MTRAAPAKTSAIWSVMTASLSACIGVITMFDTDAFSSYRLWVIGSAADRGVELAVRILPFVSAGLALVGVNQRTWLRLSVPAGPVLVLAADILGRVIVRPSELELGIVTAFVGAPVLIALNLRRRTR